MIGRLARICGVVCALFALAWAPGALAGDLEAVREALQAAPDDPDIQFRYAVLLGHEGRLESALRVLDELVESYPSYFDARVHRARILAWRGTTGEASTEVAALLDEAPDSADVHILAGDLARWGGDLDSALEHYRTASELEPRHPEVWDRLAEAASSHHVATAEQQRKARKFRGALQSYLRALEEDPEDTDVALAAAQMMSQVGRHDEAFALLERAHAADPDHFEVRLQRVRALAWAADWTRANAELAVLRADADDPRIEALAGELEVWRGRGPVVITRGRRGRLDAALGHTFVSGAGDWQLFTSSVSYRVQPRVLWAATVVAERREYADIESDVSMGLTGTWQSTRKVRLGLGAGLTPFATFAPSVWIDHEQRYEIVKPVGLGLDYRFMVFPAAWAQRIAPLVNVSLWRLSVEGAMILTVPEIGPVTATEQLKVIGWFSDYDFVEVGLSYGREPLNEFRLVPVLDAPEQFAASLRVSMGGPEGGVGAFYSFTRPWDAEISLPARHALMVTAHKRFGSTR